MDKGTVIGMATAWGLIMLAILLGGVGVGPYFDIPSILIVAGGSMSVIAGQYEIADLKRVMPAFKKAFKKQEIESVSELVEKIIFYATEVKKHGVMHIEPKINEETNDFFKEAFQLIVDGSKAEQIEPLLEAKVDFVDKRHSTMIALFNGLGSVAGSMGMIGTLIGLVAMLANLSDPASVGPAMAVALITTLYGALIGTLFAGVVANKLEQKHENELNYCDLVTRGAVLIAQDSSIGIIRMQLNAVLAENSQGEIS